LFHATSVTNAISIAQNNVNWRLTNRSRFGRGACFSPCPWYANRYAGMKGGKSYSSHSGNTFINKTYFNLYTIILAFLIVKVLVKKTETTGINYGLEIPSTNGCDTTLGNNGNVYVKYDDHTFYPEYIVHYS